MRKECYTLSESAEEAAGTLTELLLRVNWGHLVALGKDAGTAYEEACAYVDKGKFKVSVIWAKTPEHVREVLGQLVNSDIIQYGDFGSRLIGIDRNDKVVLALGKSDSNDIVEIFFAFALVSRSAK